VPCMEKGFHVNMDVSHAQLLHAIVLSSSGENDMVLGKRNVPSTLSLLFPYSFS